MSITTIAAAPSPFVDPGRPFAKAECDLGAPGGSFDRFRNAAQRLWLFIFEKTGYGAEEIRFTDDEIAAACKRSPRWVQKALRQLLGHGLMRGEDPAKEAEPRITKRFAKGPRAVAGRILGIAVKFAPPKGKPEGKAGPKGNAKPAAMPAAPAPAAAPQRAEAPVSPWLKGVLDKALGRPVSPAKSDEQKAAEADRKKAEYLASARRRKEAAARKAAEDRSRPAGEPGAPSQPSGP